MKPVLVAAVSVLALGLGVVIGRFSAPDSGGEAESARRDNGKDVRSARRNTGRSSAGRSIGRVGSAPPKKYEDRIRHMRGLAKNVQMGSGMPDFDALFGIWETARDMSPGEIHRALEDLELDNPGQREGMFVKAMLVMQLAKKDGPGAMEYAATMKGGRMIRAREMALQTWAASDPRGAYAWYETNKGSLTPREAHSFLASALGSLARTDFDTAFSKTKQVDALAREDVLRQVGTAVATDASKRERFTKYLLTLESEETRDRVARNMVESLAQADVSAAIEFVDQWPGENKNRLAHEVAEQWAQTEPEKALAWRLGRVNGIENPGEAVDDIFGDWARRDSAAARKWLEAQGGDMDKGEMHESAARRVMWDDDYPGAAKWAHGITDERDRNNSYRRIYRRWSRRDKEGANKWLDTLDDAAKAAIAPPGETSVESPGG